MTTAVRKMTVEQCELEIMEWIGGRDASDEQLAQAHKALFGENVEIVRPGQRRRSLSSVTRKQSSEEG